MSGILDDARVLARAVLERWKEVNDGGRNAYAECHYCEARGDISWHDQESSFRDPQHSTNCPVLIVKDILTGQSENPNVR
jgi:hypothetical protein